ncbi:MAG TPA: BON domain-containing protein [Terriglobales bacterium]|nr:BON domain-containing protein [Terriglobales bacterium]
MLLPTLLFAFFWLPQTPAHAPAHPLHPAARAGKFVHNAPAKPAGPKSAAALEQDLAAALRAAPLSGDQVNLAVSGDDITLRGVVHSAEHKGVATRMARAVAAKDGWRGFHVLNQIEVELPH